MELGTQGRNRLNVLVADGQPLVRYSLAEALREMGLVTYEAAGGGEVVEIVSVVPVHALVLDSDLPDMGGLETIRIIRTFKDVPPYLLTASVITRDLQVAALDSQAAAVLPKPVDMSVLSDIVETVFLRYYGFHW